MYFFTADQHFGHSNIIKFCNRPFKNVDEMDRVLIDNWNSKITNKDEVYVVGDFALTDPKRVNEIIRELKGNIYFIDGSHDRWIHERAFRNFADVEGVEGKDRRVMIGKNKLVDVKVNLPVTNERKDIWLCHYSMRSWPKSHYGTWHLYGHHHGRLAPHGKSFDVGVDCHDFYPLSLNEIAEKMKSLPMIGVDKQ